MRRNRNKQSESYVSADGYVPAPVNMHDKKAVRHRYEEIIAMYETFAQDYRVWAKEPLTGNARSIGRSGGGATGVLASESAGLRTSVREIAATLTPRMPFPFALLMTNTIAKPLGHVMFDSSYDQSESYGIMSDIEEDGSTYAISDRTKKATDHINKRLDYNRNLHMIANTIMTPRQIAMLKIKFMEQCHNDLCMCADRPDFTYLSEQMMRDYFIAVGHLNAISQISGYTMHAVTVEERYIVGLMMMSNPSFAKNFEQTAVPFLVRPQAMDDGRFSGEFKMTDGRNFISGTGSVIKGAFSPKLPMIGTTDDKLSFFDNRLMKFGVYFDAMQTIVKQNNVFSSSTSRKLLDFINANEKYYAKLTAGVMADDVPACFRNQDEAYKHIVNVMNKSKADKTDVNRFERAIESMLNDRVLHIYGVSSGDDALDRQLSMTRIKNIAQQTDPKGLGTKSPEVILDAMSIDLLKSMSASDMSDLFIQVMTNMEQSNEDSIAGQMGRPQKWSGKYDQQEEMYDPSQSRSYDGYGY